MTKATSTMTWPKLKAMAVNLQLPHLVEAASWGNPCLKAHAKLWCWWSQHCTAPVFKVSIKEREFFLKTAADYGFLHPHHKNHPLALTQPDNFNQARAKANLIRSRRLMAPKKVLQALDEGQSA
jgi:hypothetical protein